MLTEKIVFIIFGGFLLWVLLTQLTSEPTRTEKRAPEKQENLADRSPRRHRPPDTLTDFQDTDFYRTIINNNIFRPLGWRPPRPVEPYRLIGTLLPRAANTPPKAVIESTAGKRTYIVWIGENIDADTEVISIESKSVVLETGGEPRTLHLSIGF